MDKKKSKKGTVSDLRKIAEKKLIKKNKALDGVVFNEMEHELSVHKIELELQNEELLSAQSKLLNSLEEYAELFDSAPVGYFTLDQLGVIKNVNNTGSNQIGFTKKQLIGKPLSLFLSSQSYQDDFYRHVNRHKGDATRKCLQIECGIRRKDQSIFFALIDSIVVKDEEGNFRHFLTTVSDISERKEQEHMLEMSLLREKELSQMKSQFITIASHEFRTPLSTILTSAELMLKYNKPGDEEKKEKHLHKISTAVNRVKEILMDFLSVNQAEQGNIRNTPETFNISNFINNILEEIKSFDGTHTVNYKHIGNYLNVHLDKKLLKTCLSNLMINAYKYSPKGGEIEFTTEQKQDGNLTITIKDSGMGIPKKDLKNIFNQFFRAENVENIQGTGLGLNITKKLITLMGGTISFTSEENKGTTFYIKFLNAK